MINFETVTSIDDTEFDTLFDASLGVLDAGAYPWHLFTEVNTVEQKKAHIRAAYDRLLTEGFVWRVYDDEGVLLLNAGVKTGNRATFLLGLVKSNAAGTKSYLYTDDFNNARNAYWTEIGITGWTIETAGRNTPIHTHFSNRNSASKLGASMTEEETTFEHTLHKPMNLELT
tara:strand:- start:76 stop:591 length:516 start_codon:yes stop_codon:yes gene_type:complete